MLSSIGTLSINMKTFRNQQYAHSTHLPMFLYSFCLFDPLHFMAIQSIYRHKTPKYQSETWGQKPRRTFLAFFPPENMALE